jgi:hypothetical protein
MLRKECRGAFLLSAVNTCNKISAVKHHPFFTLTTVLGDSDLRTMTNTAAVIMTTMTAGRGHVCTASSRTSITLPKTAPELDRGYLSIDGGRM